MGIFIGLEGIDASGKTTISLLLEQQLNDMGISAKRLLKRYTDYDNVNLSNFSKSLKSLIWECEDDILKCIPSQSWLYMHAIWYNVLTENLIKPKLKEYDVLIVDGWFYKLFSRFKLKTDFDNDLLNTISNSIIKCDKVFILDTSPEVCWERREKFKATEMGGYDFEIDDPKQSFIKYQNMVREQLLMMSKNDDWGVVNSNDLSTEQLTNHLAKEIKHLIDNR